MGLPVARHFLLQGFHLMDESEKDSGPPESRITGRRGNGPAGSQLSVLFAGTELLQSYVTASLPPGIGALDHS